jgi:hypothetical protein
MKKPSAAILIISMAALFSCRNPAKQLPKQTIEVNHTFAVIKQAFWFGKWERMVWQNDGDLNITQLTGNSFRFDLSVTHGGNIGEIEGKARLSKDTAYYTSPDYAACHLKFVLKGDSALVINESGCSDYGGMGVYFSGTYRNSRLLSVKKEPVENMVSLGLLNAKQDAVFKSLVKNRYNRFVECTGVTNYDAKDLDSLNAKVLTSGVSGLFTEMENIIMIDSAKHIWAAAIDENQKVYYFTNDNNYKGRLPKTIENWRGRFKTYPVVYASKK